MAIAVGCMLTVVSKNPIIDIHTHPIFMGEGGGKSEIRDRVAQARRAGVEHMVVLGDVLVHGDNPSREQVGEINDQTHQLMLSHDGFFLGFCFVNPLLGEKAVCAEVEKRAAQGFRGIKLEICNNARHPAMRPVMAAARHLGLVVLQHTWDQSNIRQRRKHSDPADTAWLAIRWPEVPVIMAHLTGIGWRGVLEARGIDNLWIDTSGGQPEAGLIEYAVEQLGARRILYGSDLPIRETSVTVARVQGAEIPAAAKRAILHDNAARLLGL